MESEPITKTLPENGVLCVFALGWTRRHSIGIRPKCPVSCPVRRGLEDEERNREREANNETINSCEKGACALSVCRVIRAFTLGCQTKTEPRMTTTATALPRSVSASPRSCLTYGEGGRRKYGRGREGTINKKSTLPIPLHCLHVRSVAESFCDVAVTVNF